MTYYAQTSDDKIKSVSYERGVENFTSACGTGAVAAAFGQSHTSGNKKIEVSMPGGRVLVDLTEDIPYLIGPIEYHKTLFPEDIEKLWMN